MIYGYARVSTDGQSVAAQVRTASCFAAYDPRNWMPTPQKEPYSTPIHVAAHARLRHALRRSRRCSSPPPGDDLAGYGLFC